jgi:hypothetical protein
MKGRGYRGYVHVGADAVKTKRELDHWIKLALDFNSLLTSRGANAHRLLTGPSISHFKAPGPLK